MAKNYVTLKKVYRTHHSLVVTLPWFMKKDLGVNTGDYLAFEWRPGRKIVRVKRLELGAGHGRKDIVRRT